MQFVWELVINWSMLKRAKPQFSKWFSSQQTKLEIFLTRVKWKTFSIIFWHDILWDALYDEQWVHCNVHYDKNKLMAEESFLWQMGNSNHKDHRQGSDDKLFFEHTLYHSTQEQEGRDVLECSNVQLLLSDLEFHNELWRCLQQYAIDLPCSELGGDGCSLYVRGISKFPVQVRSTHRLNSRCWPRHLCIRQQLQHSDIQLRVEFRMLDIPMKIIEMF